MHTRQRRGRELNGFTLIEILIVVVILGILAATVLPQFTAAGDDAKESALVQNLQLLRSQIEMYKFDHNGTLPGGGSVSFEAALTGPTDVDGNTGTEFGPYINGTRFPENPFNSERGVTVKAGIADTDATGTVGWVFDKDSGAFHSGYDKATFKDF